MRPSYAKELTDTICGILKDERPPYTVMLSTLGYKNEASL